MAHVLTPAHPESAKKFLESVQPTAPGILQHIRETRQKTFQALGSWMSTAVNGVLAIPQAAGYLVANTLALPSVILHRTSKFIDQFRTKFHAMLGGEKKQAHAPAPAAAHGHDDGHGHGGEHGNGHGGGHH